MAKPLTLDEIAQKMKELATPIDFMDLTKRGIIEKKGSWYRVLDRAALPDYVWAQANTFSSDERGPLLKLPNSWARAQKSYKRLTGREYTD